MVDLRISGYLWQNIISYMNQLTVGCFFCFKGVPSICKKGTLLGQWGLELGAKPLHPLTLPLPGPKLVRPLVLCYETLRKAISRSLVKTTGVDPWK